MKDRVYVSKNKKVMLVTALVISMLVTLCPVMPTALAAPDGPVKNGGFEEAGEAGLTPAGWSHLQGWEKGFETTDKVVHSGRLALKTYMEGNDATVVPRAQIEVAGSDFTGFEVGTAYEITIWVNIPSDSDVTAAYLLPQVFNESGTEQTYAWPKDSDLITGNTGGEWKQTKVTFVPNKKDLPLSHLYIRCNENSSGTVYWDDLEIRKAGSAPAAPVATEPQATPKPAEEPAQAAASHVFTDIVGKNYEEAVCILNAIGIVEGRSEKLFDPDAGVTRAEMTAIILRLLGLSKNSGGVMPFSDVPKTHWAYNDISTAYAMGIVNGFDQVTFAPDGAVTYAQAVKMLVVTLGYGESAEAIGGYPGGYLAKASQLGMLKGLTNSGDNALSRGSMAMLVKNATEVEITVRASFGGSNITFIKVEGATLLTEYLNIYKYEDVITANYFTTISTPKRLMKNEIALGGKVFDVGTTNSADLIGRKVTVYVKDEDGANDGNVLYVKENPNVRTLTVDFDDVDPTSTENRLVYIDKSNKQANADINGAIMIYNGKLKPVWNKTDLFRNAGRLTLISNTGTGYTVIIAYEYKNYAVEGKKTEDMLLILKENNDGKNEISVDTADTAVKLVVKNADGKPATISDFREWDVISVAESEDGSVVSITRSQSKIKGKITELSDEEAVIGNKIYPISKLFQEPDNLKVDMEGNYYFDSFGELAFADTTGAKDYKYGYLVSVGVTKGLNSYPEIKMFTEDNQMVVFKAAEKTFVNGVAVNRNDLLSDSESRNEAVKRETAKLFAAGAVKEQLLRYELNTSGELNSIETATDNIDGSDYTPEFSRDGYISGTAMYLGRDIASFDNRSTITADTKIFITPAKYTGYDKDYGIMESASLVHGMSGGYKNVSLFDVTEDNIVSVVWMVNKVDAASAGLSTDNTAAIILDIAKGFSDDEEIVTKIKVFTEEGSEETLFAESDVEVYSGFRALTDVNTEKQVDISWNDIRTLKPTIKVQDLNCGDVIQYSLENGKVKMMNVMFRAESPLEGERVYSKYGADSMTGYEKPSKNGFYSNRTYGFGTIKNVSKSSIVAEFPAQSGNEMYERVYKLVGQVLLYDTKNHTVKRTTSGQLNVGDKVFTSRITYYQKLIIVYR